MVLRKEMSGLFCFWSLGVLQHKGKLQSKRHQVWASPTCSIMCSVQTVSQWSLHGQSSRQPMFFQEFDLQCKLHLELKGEGMKNGLQEMFGQGVGWSGLQGSWCR